MTLLDERFDAELPIPLFAIAANADVMRQQQPVSYSLTWVEQTHVPEAWRKYIDRMTPPHLGGDPIVFVTRLHRTLFYPSMTIGTKKHVFRPEYDVVSHYARSGDDGLLVQIGSNVLQMGLSIRRLLPSRVYFSPAPHETLEDDDALRAMGARTLVALHAMVARLKELAADRGVRLNPAKRVAPPGVRAAARMALDWLDRGYRCCTPVGRARARQLAGGHPVSDADIVKMCSYFARHAVDRRPGWTNPPTPGAVAWYAWGGDAGRTWACAERRRLAR